MLLTNTAEKTLYSGNEIFINSLLEQETEVIFTSPSAESLAISNILHQYRSIKSLILNHEQATVHAADGYARATGKPGVIFIPSGFEVTNAITGIATAQIDSVPLVVFTFVNHTVKTGWNRPQEIDIYGITTPTIKHYYKIDNISDIQTIVKDAFFVAAEGRPGVVMVEVTENILNLSAPYRMSIEQVPKNSSKIPLQNMEKVKNAVYSAKKPVLLIGGGVTISGASKLVKVFAEKARIPVVSTLMGIGSFPGNHPLFLGMLGMHGTYAANKAVHQSDLLICLGVRFGDRVTGRKSGFSPKSKKIQIDIDPAEINKIIEVDIPIVGDVKEVLEVINRMVIPGDTAEWIKEATSWQKIAPRFSDSKSELKPQHVIQMLDYYSRNDTVVATDVGQHQMWTAHNFKFRNPRLFITSGGLGTMGYGLPAAIGASWANTERDTILISGDGSFQMNYQELITAAKYRLPLKIAILKNGYLGMVRQWQEMFYKGRYSQVKITSPNFVTLAEAYGIEARSAANTHDAEMVIKEAFNHSNPIVMEFDITEEENVFPIVPPGGNNTETILNMQEK